MVFKVTPIFHRLIFLLRIVNRLSMWCHLSGYLFISRSFSRFRTWLSSSLCSWEKVMWVFFQTWFFHDIYIHFFFLWVNLCACVFAVYWSLSSNIWFRNSGFPEFSFSVAVLTFLDMFAYYFSVDIQYFKVREPTIVIVLTYSASLWFVVLNPVNSVQISIILFLNRIFVGLFLK